MKFSWRGALPLVGLLACVGDEPKAGPVADAGPTPAEPGQDAATDAGTPPPVSPTDANAPRIIVGGAVNHLRGPVVGRAVFVRGANEARPREVKTDAAGRFSMKDVLPPYDLAVKGPVGVYGMDRVFFGLTTDSVDLLSDPDAADRQEIAWESSTSVDVRVPTACAAEACSGWLSGKDGRLSFRASFNFAAGAASTFSTTLSWRGPATVSDDFTAVVRTASGRWFYSGTRSATLTQGVPTSLVIEPRIEASNGAVTFKVDRSKIPSSWPDPTIGGWIHLPGNVIFPAESVTTTQLPINMPNIPGALVRAAVYADAPDGNGRGARGFTGKVSPGTTVPTIVLYPPPEFTSPASVGATIPATGTLRWNDASAAATYIVYLSLFAPGQPPTGVQLVTMEREVPLTRLTLMRGALDDGTWGLSVHSQRPARPVDTFAATAGIVEVDNLEGLSERSSVVIVK